MTQLVFFLKDMGGAAILASLISATVLVLLQRWLLQKQLDFQKSVNEAHAKAAAEAEANRQKTIDKILNNANEQINRIKGKLDSLEKLQFLDPNHKP